jgi:hypothetical protein
MISPQERIWQARRRTQTIAMTHCILISSQMDPTRSPYAACRAGSMRRHGRDNYPWKKWEALMPMLIFERFLPWDGGRWA